MEVLQVIPAPYAEGVSLFLVIAAYALKVIGGSAIAASILPKQGTIWRKVLDYIAFNFGNAANK